MTANNFPIWYREISYQKKIGAISNGLTIPYLIGSYKIFGQPLSPDQENVELLFDDILSSEVEKCAVIQRCPNIGQYVIGIDDKEFCAKHFGKEISFKNTNGDKVLFITQNAKDLGHTIYDIIYKLKQIHVDCLNHENYSWDSRNKLWRQFDKTEMDLILNA